MARPAQQMVTQATAGARMILSSPTKMRQVANLIKGKQIDEARRILAFTPKAAARDLAKILESAIANAENNYQINQEELIVKVVNVDDAGLLKFRKRVRPRAQGRGYLIRKRVSRVRLTVERSEELAAKFAAEAATRRRTRRAARPASTEGTSRRARRGAAEEKPEASAPPAAPAQRSNADARSATATDMVPESVPDESVGEVEEAASEQPVEETSASAEQAEGGAPEAATAEESIESADEGTEQSPESDETEQTEEGKS